eukprot:1142487-Pelagomonas_calceolata.AAC.3
MGMDMDRGGFEGKGAANQSKFPEQWQCQVKKRKYCAGSEDTPYINKGESPTMLNPLLPLPLPPAHAMYYAAGTAPHSGPAQLPALDNHIN